MNRPRISLGTIMAVVIVIGLDCAICRSLARDRSGLADELIAMAVGTLPMLHVLGIGLARLIRGRVRRRAFLVGFEVAGWLALLATAVWFERLMDGLGDLMDATGVLVFLDQNTPAPDVVLEITVVLVACLGLQLAIAFASGWISHAIWRNLGAGDAPPEVVGERRRWAAVVPVALAAFAALSIEGYLQFVIDPMLQRLPTGSEATVDLSVDPMPPGAYLNYLADFDGRRVRIDQDDDPNVFEVVVSSAPDDADRRLRHLRPVRVTVLDGDQAGQAISIPHCLLHPEP